jgi:ABC-2 type transport system ATP-binding protein
VTLIVEHVTKTYPVRGGEPVVANRDISFEVPSGEVFGLLGHNGAGKTTLVEQIVGTAVPDSGRITVAGHDATAEPDAARRVTSLQPQGQVPLAGLTPRQATELLGRLRGGEKAQVTARADELFEALDIGEWAGQPGQRLSGGVRRLTGFCLAAVIPGRIVILDEPTNDVDPVRRKLLWRQVRRLADDGHAVLLVTHNVAEIEHVADRVVILDHGSPVAYGTPAELRGAVSGELRIELELPDKTTAPQLPEFASEMSTEGRRIFVRIPPDALDPAISWAKEVTRTGMGEFSIRPATLEDVYLSVVNGTKGNNS